MFLLSEFGIAMGTIIGSLLLLFVSVKCYHRIQNDVTVRNFQPRRASIPSYNEAIKDDPPRYSQNDPPKYDQILSQSPPPYEAEYVVITTETS